jgi:hypothetical protein
MPIGQPCLVDEAVEDAEDAISAAQSHVHAPVANVECRPVHVPVQKRANAHSVKM